MRFRHWLACLSFLPLGCIDFQPPAEPRYFAPKNVLGDAAEALDRGSAVAMGDAVRSAGDHARSNAVRRLRLRAVESANHLRERMVWRSAQGEIGFYDLLRWTDYPSSFVEAALEHELFEVRSFRRVTAGEVAVLEVEILAFEEVRGDSPQIEIRVRAHVTGADLESLGDSTVTVVQPLTTGSSESSVDAYSAALAEIVQRVADKVEAVVPTS